jgi:hypothetical protein
LSVPTTRLAAGLVGLRQIAGSSAASSRAVPTGGVSTRAVTVTAGSPIIAGGTVAQAAAIPSVISAKPWNGLIIAARPFALS